ncbi:MAG: Aldose epimerase family protein [Sphingomonas bacterium]|uniref:aldose 1-epimerase n=1 Tax=Sphingomonas bacterium TaxID=1895847 RepID=UPI0026253B8E|nr:aldose 1-epimerase [Sphingomonas bacterium]MDB5703317.1 Aldose epimerase family protein [Sphingomonas bacterium]
MVTLAGAGWELGLLPALGGAIGSLRYRGEDILRPTPGGAADPLDSACFPLIPYANRIAGGRFSFGGRTIRLPLNFGDHPNSLHGMAWQRAWTVAETRPDRARLEHRHGGDGWPWRYCAEQLFELGEDGLRVTLTLTNKSSEAMPAGIGLHPYFAIRPGTLLRLNAARVWLTDQNQIPTQPVAVDHFGDWAAGASIADAGFIDHSYEQWDGLATLDRGDRIIRLSAEGARDLHLFHPLGESFCCLEPVSHLPDAFNRPGAVFDLLPPGGALTLTMRIAVERD